MRRKWISILRMVRYGFSNFSRNAWLTTAATVVMVITLSIVLATFTAHMVFEDTLTEFRKKIDISVFLKDEVTDAQRHELTNAIDQLPVVTSIEYINKAQARQKYIDQNKGNQAQLDALSVLEDDNPFPASLRIQVDDTNKLADISTLVNQDQYKKLQSKEASISGERKDAIETLARAAQFTQVAGASISILFLVISMMIIFNTIRMAIFNRRDEIEIMKLIGAEKSFIRGPFIVEASLYGIFAAIIAVALLYTVLLAAGPGLSLYGIQVGPTIAFFSQWPVLIFLAELAAGILIGIVSSLLAIRRYLKV